MGDTGTEDNFVYRTPRYPEAGSSGIDINDDEDARPSTRHSGRCDLGFMDGHGEHRLLREFYTNQNPTNRWFTP